MAVFRVAVLLSFALARVPTLAAQRATAPGQAAVMAPATVMTPERLRQIGDSLSPASSRTAQLARGSGYTYALTHRDSSGTIEVHDSWTDVFIVASGVATLVTGGAVEGAKESSLGEWRGGVARGGADARIGPGDVVIIPAGTPHQLLLGAGERISYLAFKIAAAPLPVPLAPRDERSSSTSAGVLQLSPPKQPLASPDHAARVAPW